MQEGQWQKALENFRVLEKQYTLLTDYMLYDMAACYEKSGEKDKALAVLIKIISDYKDSPVYRKAFRRVIEITKENDLKSALGFYDRYLEEFPQDCSALLGKADLLNKAGLKTDALAIWKEIFFAGSSYALAAYEALEAMNYQPSRAEIRSVAGRLSEGGNHRQVLRLLSGGLTPAPADEEEKYLLGCAFFHLRRYNEAIKMLDGVSCKNGRYLLAISLVRTNKKETFYKLVDGLAKIKEQRDLFSLLSIAAELKRRDGNASEAAAILQVMLELYPDKKDEVTWSRAWLAIRQGRLNEAERLLSSLIGHNGSKKDKYLFWLGKIKEYQGQKGDVFFSQMDDQNGYHWFRAGKKRDEERGNSAEELTTKNNAPLLSEEFKVHFQRITELTKLKMKPEAAEEAQLVISSIKAPYVPAFARLLVEFEDYNFLIKLGVKNGSLSLKYPFAFRDAVLRHAKVHKVDPLLATALMREESHFKRDAVSSTGALGVMQLMPATARRMAHLKSNQELFDPEKNIGVGIKYLSGLIGHFKSLHYAIAAYNAGEHNVEKWLAAGYRDEDEFTEDIPFGETKNYVFRVLKTYGIMRSIYGSREKSF